MSASLSLGYYPGCSGLGTSMEYDASTREVCAILGITLQDIPDWTCCGSSPAHTVDHVLSTALAARNFAQAETAGITDVTTPCPSCLKNLRNALDSMEDPLFRERVDALTERPLKMRHSVKSVLQILAEDIGMEAIKAKVRRPLKGMKVVPYYGCLMTRPAETMRFDSAENPMAMDHILEALGAEVLPFPLKTDCCGASFGIPERASVMRLTGRLLDMAAGLGADAVVVACPLCQMNLDLRQGQVNRSGKTRYNLPVPYITQLMCCAFGVDEQTAGFDKLAVKIAPAFEAMRTRAAEAAAKEREAKEAAEKKAAAAKAKASTAAAEKAEKAAAATESAAGKTDDAAAGAAKATADAAGGEA